VDKPRRPGKRASHGEWERYHDAMAFWNSQQVQQQNHPGSTRHVGRPHSSRHNPQWHADKEVTGLDGRITKEHSTDPRDIEFGWEVEGATREMRERNRSE
jgi:hypothetical protein